MSPGEVERLALAIEAAGEKVAAAVAPLGELPGTLSLGVSHEPERLPPAVVEAVARRWGVQVRRHAPDEQGRVIVAASKRLNAYTALHVQTIEEVSHA